MSTETQTRQKNPTGVRKKPFAVPPVKVACLSCRSSRIRCDGKEPCSGCNNRGKECIYVQSRRGGARIPRSKRQECLKYDYVKIAQECFDDAVPTMVQPGGGLTQLDLDLDGTDTLFDCIFPAVHVPQTTELEDDTPRQTGSVRVYLSDEDIMDAYYIWLHPYFPILPSARSSRLKDNPHLWFPKSSEPAFLSLSPTALAISAILALIPHPEDPAPFEEENIIARRETSHLFAKRTLECIETDSEIPNSSISPAHALLDEHSHISRPCFHPFVPIELETVVALSILSVYEYAQRGNISKMKDRAGQALLRAMDLSLHNRGTESDVYAEARRRAWWMTYICICQASIVSSTPPAIPLFDSRFTTSFPQSPDPEAWPFFIKSQQTILLATQFVTAVGLAVDGKQDWTEISSRMQNLHNTIEPLISQSNQWKNVKPLSTDVEATVAYSLKQMSKIKLNRIKLHRYCAFYDIPVFSESHCDLKKSIALTYPPPPCGCGSSLPTQPPSLTTSVSSTSFSSPTSSIATTTEFIHPFPFSNSESSRFCLDSALAIADAFDALPFPVGGKMGGGVGTTRTMPSFACCAMQSAYTLLMVYHRTWVQQQQQKDSLQTGQQSSPQPSALASPQQEEQQRQPSPHQGHEQQQQQIQAPFSPIPSREKILQQYHQQFPHLPQRSPLLSPQQAEERSRVQALTLSRRQAFTPSTHETQTSTPEQAQEWALTQDRIQQKAQVEQVAAKYMQEQRTQLLGRCEDGLKRISEVLDGYSIAFEALKGMKDQVQVAIDCLSLV